MSPHDWKHLTDDELDAFLTESSSPLTTSHVATCPACAAMVRRDRAVVEALSLLPGFEPAADFSDRVMARMAVPHEPAIVAATVPAGTPRALAARRRAIGAILLAGGGIAAGVIWANAHPADALRWSAPAWESTGHTLWLSLQAIVANATEQPWFASLRDSLASPVRALAVMAAAGGAYAVGLLGLRRLMSEPATNAGW